MMQTGRDDFEEVVRDANVSVHVASADGSYPNNPDLPILLYRGAFESTVSDLGSAVEAVFREHEWDRSWRNGIFSYHHYHSTAHEVLAVISGSVRVQLGGPNGETFALERGDVVVLPAGTAHKNCGTQGAFQVVGAYPENGPDWDMRRGRPGERSEAEENIRQVPLPSLDPVYGASGPVKVHWTEESE